MNDEQKSWLAETLRFIECVVLIVGFSAIISYLTTDNSKCENNVITAEGAAENYILGVKN